MQDSVSPNNLNMVLWPDIFNAFLISFFWLCVFFATLGGMHSGLWIKNQPLFCQIAHLGEGKNDWVLL